MKTFKFEIIETLSRIIEIDAENYDDAFDEITTMYAEGEIVLDADDFVNSEINRYED